MCDENSAVLRDAKKKAQSVLDPVDEALSTTSERCIAAWTTDTEMSAKLYCVFEKAVSELNKRQHMPTAVSTRVDESKQVHREATKDHNL